MFRTKVFGVTKDGQFYSRWERGPRWNWRMVAQMLVMALSSAVFLTTAFTGLAQLFVGIDQQDWQTLRASVSYLMLAILSLWASNKLMDSLTYLAKDYRRPPHQRPHGQQSHLFPRRPEDRHQRQQAQPAENKHVLVS